MSDDRSLVGKIVLTLVVIVLAVPGLVIEPGPLSEIAAGSVIGSIWGYDLGIGDE